MLLALACGLLATAVARRFRYWPAAPFKTTNRRPDFESDLPAPAAGRQESQPPAHDAARFSRAAFCLNGGADRRSIQWGLAFLSLLDEWPAIPTADGMADLIGTIQKPCPGCFPGAFSAIDGRAFTSYLAA